MLAVSLRGVCQSESMYSVGGLRLTVWAAAVPLVWSVLLIRESGVWSCSCTTV